MQYAVADACYVGSLPLYQLAAHWHVVDDNRLPDSTRILRREFRMYISSLASKAVKAFGFIDAHHSRFLDRIRTRPTPQATLAVGVQVDSLSFKKKKEPLP